MKIQKIEKVKFSGSVYNLELESNSEHDDLFWIEGGSNVITHNCFPKDLNGLLYVAKEGLVETSVLEATLKTNDRVREDRDWESQEGRAIINSSEAKSNKVKSFFSSLFA